MTRYLQFLRAVWPPFPVWRRLDAAVVVVAVYSALVCAVVGDSGFRVPDRLGVPAAVNTVILSVLLGFRNREAYERWWEGRRLWGQLVNDSRNLCLKVRALPGVSADEQSNFGRQVVAFAAALRNHLRGGGRLQDLPGFEHDPAAPAHVPMFFAGRVMETLQGWRARGAVGDFDLLRLDPHARAFMDVSGACERIKSTPLPLSYRSLLRHGLVLYLATTPWFLAGETNWLAIPVMALLAYFLLGIELTAEDVEEPFGRDADDLALGTYCETIRKSVAAVLGDGDAGPGAAAPVKPESPPLARIP